MERWRAVPGWELLYEVSDQGRFKSLRRLLDDGRIRKEHIRTPRAIGKKYAHVALLYQEQRQEWLFHCLVLRTFIGSRPEGQWGLHRDGDKSNNRLSNLYYGTPQQNADDRISHGMSPKGEKHGRAKLTEAEVRLIRSSPLTLRQLAAQLGVSFGLIGHIRNGRNWTHVK